MNDTGIQTKKLPLVKFDDYICVNLCSTLVNKKLFSFFRFSNVLCQIGPAHSESANIFAIGAFFIFGQNPKCVQRLQYSLCCFRDFRLVEFVEFNNWKRSIGPPGIRICKKFCNRSIFSICFPFLKFLKRKKPACRRSRTTVQKLFLFCC